MKRNIDYQKLPKVCCRCGYEYDPKNPDKAIIIMPNAKGEVYAGCTDCVCDLGRATRAGDMETANMIIAEMQYRPKN